jgi:hypothetical protein
LNLLHGEAPRDIRRDLVGAAFLPSKLALWVSPMLLMLQFVEQYCSSSIYTNTWSAYQNLKVRIKIEENIYTIKANYE